MKWLYFGIRLPGYIFYRRIHTRLFCDPEKPVRVSTYPAIKLEKGGCKVIRVQGLDFVRRVFNLLSGKQTDKNLCIIYIFDEITRDMPQGIYVQLKDLMTRLARQGSKSLCLSSMLANPPF